MLLDADGVVQRVPGSFTARLAAAHGLAAERAVGFERALFAMEAEAAKGAFAFAPALVALAQRWCPDADVERLLDVWRHVETVPGVRELIAHVRGLGIRCGLATNQQDLRADYLSCQLGYARLFDIECYSCHLGARKPDVAFFAAAIEAVGCAPDSILFIDDAPANVDAALACGLHALLHEPAHGAAGIAAALRAHGIDVR